MIKVDKKLYNWLLKNKGYLKSSIETIYERYPGNINSEPNGIFETIKFTLKEARKASKLYSKLNLIENKISNKLNKSELITPSKSNIRNIPGVYLVTGCSHAPWQNKEMYNSIFNYLTKESITLQGLILAGDFLDLNSLSSHDKGKKPILGVNLAWEYAESNKFLDEFKGLSYTKSATKDYIFGNHEDRYLRLMSNNDESKYGDALQSPKDGLNLLKRGYNVYTNWKNDSVRIGNHLNVCHGEFVNVHSAKKTIDTYRESTMYFHTHRYQIYVEGMVGGFNMGAGADFNSPIFGYATRAMKNSWVNGCALVTLDENGFYHIQPLIFMGGKLIINGKSY